MGNATLIHIAVVGHTNTGKTSLLRTLTRDRLFGEVADAPGTTRHVQAAMCWLDGQAVLAWHDTPGLEDSIALRDWIESVPGSQGLAHGQRLERSDRIERFLSDAQAAQRFEQEHRVLQQVVKSDAVLYVIDTRDPVLPKHRDELYLLSACAKPVLPVLNFIASPHAEPEPWVQALARLGLHVYLRFDTVSPPLDGEALVFETLGLLLLPHQPVLQRLASDAQKARMQRREEALGLIAEMLVNVACAHAYSDSDSETLQRVVEQQQSDVRVAEQQCVDALLVLFQFGRDDYLPARLAWSDGRWQTDLFSADAMRDVGAHLGKGAAAGALAGAAIDVMSAGLTLGTGTLIGAAAGTAWQGLERWGHDLLAKVKGERSVRVSDQVVVVLAMRQLQLLDALERRGHAAQGPVRLEPQWSAKSLSQADLVTQLAAARRHDQWCALKRPKPDSAQRQMLVDSIARLLNDALQNKSVQKRLH